ncbi:MAG: alanine racemase [Candidatus Omnitrophota bacterium]
MKITKPTFIVDKKKAMRNIERMVRKIDQSEGPIRFRPHFKTHQSAPIGQWFRERGITAITVSSVDMAFYFAQNGWNDITIAILVNPLEIEAIDRLAGMVDLSLVIDSEEMATFLQRKLTHNVNLWIKIDTGYHRTGIEWDQTEEILSTARMIRRSLKLSFKGVLTHAGHAYKARSAAELEQIYADTVFKMNRIRNCLEEKAIDGVEISIGDTPTCSAIERFYGTDEIRCGNFVFYDVSQWLIGACQPEDIAAAVSCPVIARYPRRNEIVVYGGAVHLSKESITDRQGRTLFGLVALPDKISPTWGPVVDQTFISALSQEHGIIKTTDAFIREIRVGDTLMVLPVHSCLASNLLKNNYFFA